MYCNDLEIGDCIILAGIMNHILLKKLLDCVFCIDKDSTLYICSVSFGSIYNYQNYCKLFSWFHIETGVLYVTKGHNMNHSHDIESQ